MKMRDMNSFIIIKIDTTIKEGNNAQVKFLNNDNEFIKFLIEVGDDINKFIVFKNGQEMSTYECERELRIYETRDRIWSNHDIFGYKGGE